MRSKRTDYKTKKIERLEEEVKQLKASSSTLEKENAVLRKRYEEAEESLKKMRDDYRRYADLQTQAIQAANDARKTYEAMTAECLRTKKDYAKQFAKLLNGMRKTDARLTRDKGGLA